MIYYVETYITKVVFSVGVHSDTNTWANSVVQTIIVCCAPRRGRLSSLTIQARLIDYRRTKLNVPSRANNFFQQIHPFVYMYFYNLHVLYTL